MLVAAPILLLFGTLAAGIPVGFSLLIAGVVGVWLNTGSEAALGFLQTVPFRATASYALVTIPMFVLMARFISQGGLARDIFVALQKWTGRLPGGAGIATVMGSAGFGAVCGSSAAGAAAMGSIAIPEMKRLGYPASFSVGTVAAAGTLASIIPPANALIIYAILTNSSVGKMLIAGIIPGAITAVAYALMVTYWARRAKGITPDLRTYPLREKARAAAGLWPFAVLIALVLGGIYAGVVTAIEAAALGAFGALVLTIVLRRVTPRSFAEAGRETAYTTSMILAIVFGASMFGYFLSIVQAPQELLSTLSDAGIPRYGVLFLVLGFALLLGFFMDQAAIQFLALPIVFPIIAALGFNPIWFGILFTKIGEIGLVTPPVGLNVFVASAAGGETVETGFAGVWRFVLTDLVVLALLIAVPWLSTGLAGASSVQ